VTLTNSTASGNTSKNFGGGIYSGGGVTLTNSTVSGNTARGDGGGIFSGGGTIRNSTITNNTADSSNSSLRNGGGIFNSGGSVTIQNSIIAGNFDTPNNAGGGSINPDVSGVFVDSGSNLIGDSTGSSNFTVSTLVGTAASRLNPQLAPLGNYGGTTQTHALLPNSPALNAGNNAGVAATDQRGAPRIFGGVVDIGAFESQVVPPVTTTPIQFSIARGGFGGVFPSREDLEGRSARLDEQDLDISFTQVLCLDASLAITQTTSIPTCKKP